MLKQCPECEANVLEDRASCFRCGFSFGAERSGVLQGCPPSASGSARPVAVEQIRVKSVSECNAYQLADASDRSARFSVRTVLEKWRLKERELRQCAKENRRRYLKDHYSDRIRSAQLDDYTADIYRNCAADIEAALSDAPPAAGERAVARNAGDKV